MASRTPRSRGLDTKRALPGWAARFRDVPAQRACLSSITRHTSSGEPFMNPTFSLHARAPRTLLAAIRLAIVVGLAAPSQAQAQVTPPMERLARELEKQTPVKDGRGQPAQPPTDTTTPSFRLPAQIA